MQLTFNVDNIRINMDASSVSTKKQQAKTKERKPNADQCMAASIGDQEWLNQSLKNGHDPNGLDKNGFAPIHLAALHGNLNCLKLLVETYGVDVNFPSSVGWRPLHLSINKESSEKSQKCVKYLLEHGADVHCKNDDGVTVVHQAATEGLLDCLHLLLAYDAPLHEVDVRGHTAHELAKLWGHKKCARVIRDAVWKENKTREAEELKKLTKLQEQYYELQHEALFQVQNEREFYGDVTFTNWLEDRGFQTAGNAAMPTQGKEDSAMRGLEKRLLMSGKIEDSAAKMERLANSYRESRKKRQIAKESKKSLSDEQLSKDPRGKADQPTKVTSVWNKTPSKRTPTNSVINSLMSSTEVTTWNYSTNVDSDPIANIKQPTFIALGVEPEERPFGLLPTTANLPVQLEKDGRQQPTIRFQLPGGGTEDAKLAIPSLPSDMVYQALSGCPSTRVKIPQEFKAFHIEDVTHKRKTAHEEDQISMCLMLTDKFLRPPPAPSSTSTSTK